MGEQHGHDLRLDLESDHDLDHLSEELSTRNKPLRLVINCSGRLHGPHLQPEKRLKFSAFARKEKDYSVDEKQEMRKKMATMAERFEPKEEFSRIKFDENIRHRNEDYNLDTDQ